MLCRSSYEVRQKKHSALHTTTLVPEDLEQAHPRVGPDSVHLMFSCRTPTRELEPLS